jgi:serine/threonine protein kinase
MEYLEGETLDDRLVRGPLPAKELLLYATQIADALDHAHRERLVHRDLKPSNVMLTASGAKLLDFGLAQSPVAEVTPLNSTVSLPSERLTAEGSILGTFQYMAPEQLEGKETDARTDIFAFGTLLYEMATARKAFDGDSQASVIASILKDDPPAIASTQPSRSRRRGGARQLRSGIACVREGLLRVSDRRGFRSGERGHLAYRVQPTESGDGRLSLEGDRSFRPV